MNHDGLIWPLIQIIFALIAVLALIYLVFQTFLSKWIKKQQVNRIIQIQEQIALDSKHTIYLLRVDAQQLIIATSEQSISLIGQIPINEFPHRETLP